jgi:cytochrome c
MVAVLAFSPGIHAGTPDATPLLGKYHCQMCHDQDKTKMGPAYKSIARKYADQQGAAATLENIVRNGTKGTISMPPTNAPESDISAMVAWILDQK